jgi:hypothetical protein
MAERAESNRSVAERVLRSSATGCGRRFRAGRGRVHGEAGQRSAPEKTPREAASTVRSRCSARDDIVRFMQRAIVGGFALGVALLSNPASSQVSQDKTQVEPGSALAPQGPSRDAKPAAPASSNEQSQSAPSCVEPARATELTPKYDVERERREFEQEAARYVKLREFTQRLEDQRRQQLEKDFDDRVSLFVRKQVFTKQLIAERQRAQGPSVTAPPPTPSPGVGVPQQQ